MGSFAETDCGGQRYEVILLDVGECVQGLFQMLDLCDRIYIQF